jgi:type I restriction enzyme S subunit
VHGRRQIKEVSSNTSGLHTLSISKVERISLAIPPENEISRIMTEIERRFSVLDQIEATVQASLARCGKLRQAILKRALEGRLVPAV